MPNTRPPELCAKYMSQFEPDVSARPRATRSAPPASVDESFRVPEAWVPARGNDRLRKELHLCISPTLLACLSSKQSAPASHYCMLRLSA